MSYSKEALVKLRMQKATEACEDGKILLGEER